VLAGEPLQRPEAIDGRDVVTVPKPAQVATQMIVGQRGDRKDRIFRHADEARRRRSDAIDERVAIVAVDLVWLDDESLCDVPLLERKRILESIVTESELIRVGMHVRPPVDSWLGSWRTFGFRRMAYKAANSRYVPGQKNQEWAQAEIPLR
jgi:ATP-dependent DNA ligase